MLDHQVGTARREGESPEEVQACLEKANAAWERGTLLSEAPENPSGYFGRDGKRVHAEADGRSMVTDVLRNYANRRDLQYDGFPKSQPQRGAIFEVHSRRHY